jgi:histidinol dehydrogenase
MLPIYNVDTARQTILRRPPGLGVDPPASLLASVEGRFGKGVTPAEGVRRILADVAANGDEALHHWSAALDQYTGRVIQVPPARLDQAAGALPQPLLEALNIAIDRIRTFHALQPLPNWSTEILGGQMGQRANPVERAGIYVPGGTAPLPSSLLMAAIPAQVAGVPEIIVCTPPEPQPIILAAARLCGVETVFQVGGAQAIAAMAFGTETIPRVDKIVGPGNLFVTLAKQQVFGHVGIDSLAGPTETVIIADGGADPAWVAADLLAQAEHDPLAAAILLTPDPALALRVQEEVARQVETLSRREIIAQSLAQQGGAIVTPDLETAIELANAYAPEHYCLAVEDPESWAGRVRNAGALFLGEHACEVLGDYVAGPNHVLPTGGTARFASPLSVFDFIKITSVLSLDAETSARLSQAAATLAKAEALTAHAAAAERRFQTS